MLQFGCVRGRQHANDCIRSQRAKFRARMMESAHTTNSALQLRRCSRPIGLIDKSINAVLRRHGTFAFTHTLAFLCKTTTAMPRSPALRHSEW